MANWRFESDLTHWNELKIKMDGGNAQQLEIEMKKQIIMEKTRAWF